MLKEQMNKIKEMFNSSEGNSKKKIEKLVVFVIILIITMIVINMILKDDKNESKTENLVQEKTLAQDNVNDSTDKSSLEERLEKILSSIQGVGNVKVLITYSQTSQIIPMYDEDSSTSTTEETDSGGGTRTVNESTTKKDVIYEDKNGTKTPITQSVVNPKIEGAIITAQGANDANIKTSIVQAVEAVTGLATYKIQVFEMKD